LHRVSEDDGMDDALTEAALERIVKTSGHLISKETPKPEIGQVLEPSATQAAASGPKPPPGKAPLTSKADVEKLTTDEINERWDEVQAVLVSTSG